MPTASTRRRTRREPPQSESLFQFCRHCGNQFEPNSTPVADVCQDCIDMLYFRCDECEAYHDIDTALTNTSGRVLCASCAEEHTFVCLDCGCRYELSSHERHHDRSGRTICDLCVTNYSRCDCCGGLLLNGDLQQSADGRFCWSCMAYNSGRAIMSYSFKPEPVFHDAEGCEPTGLYLGVELEMDYGDAEAAAKRISEEYGQKLLYFKHDGSLDEGCELVTHPMSPEYMMSDTGKAMWRGICASALAEGMRSHDTDTCGFHVHVSRDFFGANQTSQELTELKLIATVDRLFEPIVIFSRRKRHNIDRWAPKCNAPKEDAGWVKKAQRVSCFAKRDRYHAINVTNAHTIEFRLFRGTLKADTILATLQFVTGLCHLVKSSNPSQMDRFCWYDLADAVMEACPVDTTELHNYLIERELIVPEGDFQCA